MSATLPVPVPVPVKETAQEKIQSIFTNISKFIQGTENVVINLGVAEEPLLTKMLPSNISTPLNNAISIAAGTFAAMEKAEQAVGSSAMSYGEKVATIIGLQAAAIGKELLAAGLEVTQANLQTVVSVATGVATLNFATLTKAPVVQTVAAVPVASTN